ncbi:hypothetical protein FB451DRAFT_1234699 [Mycena latifolia]|nr:hypothetical protein FB451DRAFT_1234699 [Mycena latifolia]
MFWVVWSPFMIAILTMPPILQLTMFPKELVKLVWTGCAGGSTTIGRDSTVPGGREPSVEGGWELLRSVGDGPHALQFLEYLDYVFMRANLSFELGEINIKDVTAFRSFQRTPNTSRACLIWAR